jgi:hypothetical protein
LKEAQKLRENRIRNFSDIKPVTGKAAYQMNVIEEEEAGPAEYYQAPELKEVKIGGSNRGR